LHKKKLIHGDIHSSNILITEDNSVKIIDMGLTLNVEEIEKNELVKFGGVIFYMPPERINLTTIQKYSKEPDLYSDVYQIGMLIYLIIYNKTPFKGFIWEELAQNIKSTNPTFPDSSFLNYTVPRGLINIVKKCLAKNPVERFRNATEILENFETHVFKEKNIVVT
jgi:serine/threonine-protein kinase